MRKSFVLRSVSASIKCCLVLLCCSFLHNVVAQNTVGLLSYNQSKAFDGYNLIYPHNQPNVYLIDNCGEIVHTWEDEANFRPGNTAYLTEDGHLYKTKRDGIVTEDAIWAGGGGSFLEIRDWDNNLIWQYEMNDSINRLHHDFAITDDGNIIALAWELKTLEECIQAGRDTSTVAQGKMWPDWIFEINPSTDEIVWEWHAWDHLIQDHDSTKSNFGVVADNPNRIDINFGRLDGHPDWMHGNALDYNSFLDQVMLSVPYNHEFWIIDHTTTTEEAAQDFGGFGNRGGDLMYRWGNPVAYQAADSSAQKLFFQHDAHWVDDFIEPSHPEFGKIAVFNNRVGADFSTANVILPPWDMYEWKYSTLDDQYEPQEFEKTITHPTPTSMWSTGLSSIQILPNGNTLLTAGRFGYSFELTPDDEIVWEYITPIIGGAQATQGDSLTVNNNLTFRMKRYPSDFAGFDGRDLSSKGWLELTPNESYCDELTDLVEPMASENYKVYPNPANNLLTIEWDGMLFANIEIHNQLGQRISKFKCSGGRKYLDVSSWHGGVYFITIDHQYSRKFIIAH